MRGLEQKTILVVDDDVGAREAMSEFLSLNGFTVACAENGQAALDEIGNSQVEPALILLDVLMPVMDGHTFLKHALQDDRIKNIPIIVTTAQPSTSPPGATATLAKPIRPERLLTLVRRFLQSAAA
jgi:CheY-like chemotaxis protein